MLYKKLCAALVAAVAASAVESAQAQPFGKPTKLSRVSVDVAAYPAVYPAVYARSIRELEFENACLESRLAEETSAYHRETSISQIDSQEEDGDVTKPMRLRGGQRQRIMSDSDLSPIRGGHLQLQK